MTEINLITISLASANRIRQWAEKTLPNGKVVGEVINPETVHYKTLKPIKGGLFCERIFLNCLLISATFIESNS